MALWQWTVLGVGASVASWAVLALLANRLPDGTLREVARFLPDTASPAVSG